MNRYRIFIFFPGKALVFCCFVVLLLLMIANIPFDIFMNQGPLKPYALNVNRIIHCILSLGGCGIIANKFKLTGWIEFNTVKKCNYWMFLIPLFFPGILSLGHVDMSCFDEGTRTALFIVVLLLSGWVEELAFRGLIQGYLTHRCPAMSTHRICLTTATCFALIHFNNLQNAILSSVINQAIYAFYTGLLFSALMIRTRNIWLLGTVHALLNLLSLSCSDTNLVISEVQVAGSFQDHLVQATGTALVYSPLLLIYILLVKGTANDKSIE